VHLSDDQQDAIREIIGIGIGRAAATLSELMGTRIEMAVPRVTLRMWDDANETQVTPADEKDVVVIQDFRGEISGRSALSLPHASGLRLAQLLGDVAEPVDELDLEMSGILTEVGNIMLNSVLGSLANIIGTHLVYSVPHCYSGRPVRSLLSRPTRDPGALLTADAEFCVRSDSIHGSLLVVMDTRGLETILGAIGEVDT
jgi:chemotaxis protein CheC